MAKMYQKVRSSLRAKLNDLSKFDNVDGSYIYLLKWLLFQQGFWPAIDKSSKTVASLYRYWNARIALGIWMYLAFIGFPMAAYSVHGKSFLVQVEPIIFSIVFGIGVAFAGSLLYQSDRFQKTFEAFEAMKDCAQLLPVQSYEKLKLRKNTCHFFFSLFLLCMVIIVFVVCIAVPVLFSTRRLFLRAWYPYNQTAWPYYELTLAIWSVWLISSVAYICPAAVLLAVLLIKAWSHLELLCHNLALLRETALQRTSLKIQLKFGSKQTRRVSYHQEVSDEMALALRYCVLHHIAVVRLVRTIGATYNVIVTQLLVAFLIPLSLILYSIKNSDHVGLTTMFQLLAMLCIALSLYAFFYFADRISDQSEMVRESAFACDWLKAPDSLKRSLRIVMSFSNQPLVITVAGGIPLSLDAFRQVFYLTYKYYSFVIDMSSKKTVAKSHDSLIYLGMPD